MSVDRARTVDGGFDDLWLDGLDAAPPVAVSDPAEALVLGGAGQDFIHVAGDGLVPPAGFADRPDATAEADDINGGQGDDLIHAGAGDDTVYGGIGNDTIDGGVGADRMEGGSGNDTYFIDDAGDMVIDDIGVNSIFSSTDLFLVRNVVRFTLTGSDDLIARPDPFNAFYGNATINGNSGDNTIYGGYGGDTIFGGEGDDTLRGRFDLQTSGRSDGLYGEGGNDYLVATASGSGNTLDGGAGDDTMQGSFYDDSYYVDSVNDLIIDQGRDTVYSSVTYTLPQSLAELNLIGEADIMGTGNASANLINGNSGDNVLVGAAGNDTLAGGAGADTMYGGHGDDTYIIHDAYDEAIENEVSLGVDVVQAYANFTLGDRLDNLILHGTLDLSGQGNAISNILTGNVGNNQLDGAAGNDSLFGGGGDDTLQGSEGNDTLNGWFGSDTLIGGLGLDLATYATSNEGVTVNLAIIGPQIGPGSAIGDVLTDIEMLEGSNFTDVLSGDALANTLIGGQGADYLSGGLGDDTYLIDASDTLTEVLDGGFDTVTCTGNFVLPENIEALIFTGGLGIGNSSNNQISGSQVYNGSTRLEGRAGDDQLTSSMGADTLDGGIGVDTMTGGAGDDTYVVDDIGDVVVETYGHLSGRDHIISTVSITLSLYVEDITLTGSADVDGKGNDNSNRIVGNAGANRLIGAYGLDTLIGGAGNDSLDGGLWIDTMSGGTGDDAYVVDNLADTITELAGEGFDTVVSGVSFTLTANLEALTLSGLALSGNGNGLANTITGGDIGNTLRGGGRGDTLLGEFGDDEVLGERGHDILNGGQNDDTLAGGRGDDNLTGGQGVDLLTGGAGADTFVFRTPSGTAVGLADRITDFRRAQGDLIDLSNIDADLALEGNQAFILGGSAFTNTAGELIQVAGAGGVTLILGDMTGDGVAEFEIELAGAPVLVAADFIL